MHSRDVPASYGQRLLWVLDHYRGGEGALNCPVLCRVRGALDAARLERALAALTARHESLRTTFRGRGPQLTQVVHEPRPVPLAWHDLRGDDAEERLRAAVAVELGTRIDATQWPVRASVWRVRDDEHVLCVNVHHVVTDAWSCPVLFRDLFRLYADESELPPPAAQYAEFALRQQHLVATGGMRAHEDYWRRQLSGVRLPQLPARPGGSARRTARTVADIEPAVAMELRRLAQENRTTTFAALLSVHYAVLHGLTGQNDLAVASLFANRSGGDFAETVGFLANMVVLRTRLGTAPTFARTMRATHLTTIGAITHQQLPYQLVPLPELRSGTSRADDVVFQIMAEPVYATRFGDLDVAALVPEDVGSRFDLELALVPTGDGFRAVLFYDAGRFSAEFADDLLRRYASVAAAAAAEPDAPLSSLSL